MYYSLFRSQVGSWLGASGCDTDSNGSQASSAQSYEKSAQWSFFFLAMRDSATQPLYSSLWSCYFCGLLQARSNTSSSLTFATCQLTPHCQGEILSFLKKISLMSWESVSGFSVRFKNECQEARLWEQRLLELCVRRTHISGLLLLF